MVVPGLLLVGPVACSDSKPEAGPPSGEVRSLVADTTDSAHLNTVPSNGADDSTAARDSVLRTIVDLQVSHIKPQEFPELPDWIVTALVREDCLIPQVTQGRGPSNAISGEFFEAGHQGWAVVCLRKRETGVLVFDEDSTRPPAYLGWGPAAAHIEIDPSADSGRTYGWTSQLFAIDTERARYSCPAGKTGPLHEGISDVNRQKVFLAKYRGQDGRWTDCTGPLDD